MDFLDKLLKLPKFRALPEKSSTKNSLLTLGYTILDVSEDRYGGNEKSPLPLIIISLGCGYLVLMSLKVEPKETGDWGPVCIRGCV